MHYLLIDGMNLFFRAKHVAKSDQIEEKIGMGIHILLNALVSSSKKHQTDHVVFCTDSSSWRKVLYPAYKQNRKDKEQQQTEEERLENQLFLEAYNELIEFLRCTNVTVLQEDLIEADDFIAMFIDAHPNDQHTIISTDSDFIQLVQENVTLYNPVQNIRINLDGVRTDDDKFLEFSVKDKIKITTKIIEQKELDPSWPAMALFTKCIRGDAGDNIMTAYPDVRYEDSKKKIGIKGAFRNLKEQTYDYMNFMNQTWKDHLGVTHTVKDCYERNRSLIDLRAQPAEVKEQIRAVLDAIKPLDQKGIGFKFMQYTGRHKLQSIAQKAPDYIAILAKPYK